MHCKINAYLSNGFMSAKRDTGQTTIAKKKSVTLVPDWFIKAHTRHPSQGRSGLLVVCLDSRKRKWHKSFFFLWLLLQRDLDSLNFPWSGPTVRISFITAPCNPTAMNSRLMVSMIAMAQEFFFPIVWQTSENRSQGKLASSASHQVPASAFAVASYQAFSH